ncbi:Type IV pilus biogenesis factor PilY1 [Polaromonas vacuolata]|uniref:Type IV pilus biogenesis factor PilY1 n=1 Tax=Polaromonas vacuolata TaxID=37448 RepID=A0A6H2HA12_9BURK|nr:PilC/PilY family type IV pilus protein [Polaromonas vacuolata]QJC56709.1 Type IV pilus biogenesis factor PilY1 [Polaromonas vacuolata]
MLRIPLQAAGTTVAPNLMFTLDDSGSMGWECLPDSICVGSFQVGVMPDMTANWKHGVATADSQSVFNMRVRSPAINLQYYNPNVRYQPWMKKDGSRWPATLATQARVFPEIANDTSVINLATLQSFDRRWCISESDCGASSTQSIYLAQYYDLTSGNGTAANNFTLVQITAAGTYPSVNTPKHAARNDCAGISCTGAEELQNFSNWYSYHRTRMRVAIAGTSEAFYAIPATFRVGYGRINNSAVGNIDGQTTSTVEQGVRPFSLNEGGSKNAFYDWLNQQIPRYGGTPLRRAMDNVGQYFSYTDSRGPWGDQPGTTSDTPAQSCRRSFHVLMTDGMWNSDAAPTEAAKANVDNSLGPVITGVNNQRYQYSPARPYQDEFSNTLADVAMYYWVNDLNPGLENAVRPTSTDPAFWQHLVTYTIGFGVSGRLNPDTALPGLTAGSQTWPEPGENRIANIDDLWHAAVNSRGRFLNASNSTQYAEALKNIVDEIRSINGSESGVAVSAKAISATSRSRKYVPTYSSAMWSGDVEATALSISDGNQSAIWRASEHIPAFASRNIVVLNSAATSVPKSLAFNWDSMTVAMRTQLFGANDNAGRNLVNYLRGERSLEGNGFRQRASALGDIVNSAPVLVKDQLDGQYDFLPDTDSLRAARDSYRKFLTAKKLREAQLFVGANDGMLHAFSDSTGAESFAFIPGSLLDKMKRLSESNYIHDYYVDGPVVESDVYDSGANKWRNLVVAGLGAGAKAIFAINVPVVASWATGASPPTPYSASTSAPSANDVMWEINTASTGFAELGYQLAAPEHGVMRDGTWVVIVGNGYESASHKAQLFIINAITGVLIKVIDTGRGSNASRNGLGGVRLVRNIQKQIVAAYAGDQLGNLWKFDLSSSTRDDWNVAFGTTGADRNPLYTTASPEPISAAPTYVLHPSGGVMVLFGSGKLFETTDGTDTGARALYGVWDNVAIGATSIQSADRVTEASSIVNQSLSNTALSDTNGVFYGLMVTPVDYATKRGWRLPLSIAPGQRLVDDPEVSIGRVMMQTVTPVNSISCQNNYMRRHAFVLDPFMNAIVKPTFDTNADHFINATDSLTAVSIELNINGPATVVHMLGTSESGLVGSGVGSATSQKFQGNSRSAKRDWRQLNQP